MNEMILNGVRQHRRTTQGYGVSVMSSVRWQTNAVKV
jgi:hypothetical protein